MNTILIICDQLTGLKYLDADLLDDLEGIKKFRAKSIHFNNHFCNSTPCSASRAVMYTGKNANANNVTDNVQSTITWQKSMKNVSQGLKTLGSYFVDIKESRYVGKLHLAQELDPNNYIKYIPRQSTENFLHQYDFDIFNKMGDFCFDTRTAFFNDSLVTEELLPNGTNKLKCDFYDRIEDKCYDGAIPYMKQKILKNENFLLCCNYDNPHDILYTNINTDIQNLTTPSLQINGLNPFLYKDTQSVSSYNDNFTKYNDLKLFHTNSLIVDNQINSSTNKESIDIAIMMMILQKYYFYGIDYHNLHQYKEYQTAYYRCIKHVDGELLKLYDFLETNGLFDNSVICLTSDHGEYYGAHGLLQKAAPIYNGGNNVPLFISYPNMPEFYKNYTCDIITSHMNLLPTLLVLSGYDGNFLKSEMLAEPIINSNGLINYNDFNVVFTFLSVTFGALLANLVKRSNFRDIGVNLTLAENDLLFGTNYLTLQGFSVCSKLTIDEINYNCGYYFSLFNIYIQTIKYYTTNANPYVNQYLKQNKQKEPDDKFYILKDNKCSILAYVGNKKTLDFVLYTDPIVETWNEPIIIEYEVEQTLYNKFLFIDPVYGCYIYTLNTQSQELVEKYFNNMRNIDNYIKNSVFGEKNYMITNLTENSEIIYLGSFYNLMQLKNFDFNVDKLVKMNMIIYSNNTINNKLYINHPLLTDIKIVYTNQSNVEIIRNIYVNNKDIIEDIGIKDDKLLLNLLNNKFNQNNLKKNGSSYNLNIFNTIHNFLYNLSDKTLLKMPGLGLNINELQNLYQVQIFDNTNDSEEIYNLVDSSRINNTNPMLIDKCLNKLYENIIANGLEFIYISLPAELIFENLNFFTEIQG